MTMGELRTRSRQAWRVRRVRVACLMMFGAGLTGCAVDVPDAAHDAYAEVTNQCSDSVAVAVAAYPGDHDPATDTSGMHVVAAGETVGLGNPLYLPLSDSLYVWAVAPGAERIGEPRAVPVTSLESYIDDYGLTTYRVEITGALCP